MANMRATNENRVQLGPDMIPSQFQQNQPLLVADAAELGAHADMTSRANEMLSTFFYSTHAPPHYNPMPRMRPQGYPLQAEQFAYGTAFDPQAFYPLAPDMSMHSRIQDEHDELQIWNGEVDPVMIKNPMVPQSARGLSTNLRRTTVLPSSNVPPQSQQEPYNQMGIPSPGSASHNSSNSSIPPKGKRIANSLYDPEFQMRGTYSDPFLRAFADSEYFDKFHQP